MLEKINFRDNNMSEPRAWLAETADNPVEEMSDFFTASLDGCEEHSRRCGKLPSGRYVRFDILLPYHMRLSLCKGRGSALPRKPFPTL